MNYLHKEIKYHEKLVSLFIFNNFGLKILLTYNNNTTIYNTLKSVTK